MTPTDKRRVEEIREYFKKHEPDDDPSLFFLLTQLDEAHEEVETWKSRAEINGKRGFELQDKLHEAHEALSEVIKRGEAVIFDAKYGQNVLWVGTNIELILKQARKALGEEDHPVPDGYELVYPSGARSEREGLDSRTPILRKKKE